MARGERGTRTTLSPRNSASIGSELIVRVLVGNLRQKLGDNPSTPHYIHAIQGVGYRLSD